MSLQRPNYYCWEDRELYEELMSKACNGEKLTEEEDKFVGSMYHQEEYACGLDEI